MNDQQERYTDPTEIQHKIGPTGQLTINNVSGEIELRANDTDEVTVVVRSESGHAQWLPLTVRKGDGSLTIDVEKRGSFALFGTSFGSHDGMEFEVSVPRKAWVMVNAVSADIRSRFLAGDQSYKTVSGDIELDPDGGKLRVQTVSGDVKVSAAEPCELSVSTTSGDLNVQGAVIERFDAKTVSGDIQFDAGLGIGLVHTIETVSGDISLESYTGVTVEVRTAMDMRRGGNVTKVAGDGAAQVRFRTLSGDCHVLNSYEVDADGQPRGKHGRRKHERFEHTLERRIQEQVRRSLGRMPDDIDFPGRPDVPPIPPMPPAPPMAPAPPAYNERAAQRDSVDQLEVLRALERGEIDVDEAARRLQEA